MLPATYEACADPAAVLDLHAALLARGETGGIDRLAAAVRVVAVASATWAGGRRAALRGDRGFLGLVADVGARLEAEAGVADAAAPPAAPAAPASGAAVVSLLRSLVRLGARRGACRAGEARVVTLAADAAARRAGRLSLAELAAAAGALSTWGLDGASPVYAALAAASRDKLRAAALAGDALEPAVLARLVGVLGRARGERGRGFLAAGDGVFLAAAVLAARAAHALAAPALADVAAAFAADGAAARAPELFALLAREAAPRVGAMADGDLAKVAWAFGTAGAAAPALFAAVADEAVARVRGFALADPAHVAALAAGFSRDGERRARAAGRPVADVDHGDADRRLFAALAVCFERSPDAFGLGQVALLAGAFADRNLAPPRRGDDVR